MRKVLWFLLFIFTCRCIRVALTTAEIGPMVSSLCAFGLHLYGWGRLPLSQPWATVNYLLVDCKVWVSKAL
jgi:hypothetical protein